MPKGFELEGHGAVEESSYVLVDASSVVPCGADYKYTERMLKDYVPILTSEWETYAEKQYVSELKEEGDDFLLYFEQIVLKEKDNKVPKTTRGSSGSGLKAKGKAPGKVKGKAKATTSSSSSAQRKRPKK
jgi:hypothetical protein